MTETPKPGIYEDVPFGEYLLWDAVSNSRLSLALRSLLHYQTGFVKEPTQTMRFGSLVHCGQLEPLALASRYVVMPEYHVDENNHTAKGEPTQSKSTRYYRGKVAEFIRVNEDKEIAPRDWYDQVCGLVKSLASHRLASDLLGGSGPVEVSIIWEDPDTGLLCKGRIDKWQRTVQRFTDLKTCRDPMRFSRSIGDYGYHRQAFFYQQGIAVLTGELHTPWLVAVEPNEPWGCRAAPLHEEWLTIARDEVSRALRRIADAQETGDWPGYSDPDAWLPPGWYSSEPDDPVELVVGGKTVTV